MSEDIKELAQRIKYLNLVGKLDLAGGVDPVSVASEFCEKVAPALWVKGVDEKADELHSALEIKKSNLHRAAVERDEAALALVRHLRTLV